LAQCLLFDSKQPITRRGKLKLYRRSLQKSNLDYHELENLLTLEDTVEFFNLILGTKLMQQEKQDLVAFMRTL
jgi:hypothetical protein